MKLLLRRICSLGRHSSSNKRLGACLMFEQIYRLLREHEALVDMFTVEILVCFMHCLSLSHADDSSLGNSN